MKILSIVWYKIFPPAYGGQKGIAGFLDALSKYSQLVCICSDNNESTGVQFPVHPVLPVHKRQFLQPSSWKKIAAIADREKATHLILEHPYHGIGAYKAARKTGSKLIVHSHNIESERFREIGKWWWRILRTFEKRVHRKADLNIFKTQEDLDRAIALFGLHEDKCMIIPYGVSKPKIVDNASAIIRQRHGIAEDHKILLFAGTLDYLPNAEAVNAIFNQVAPYLQDKTRIIICGRNRDPQFRYLEQFNHPRVIMAGEVNDIETYFSGADLFINPVFTGGGIQTKTLEALSYELKVVSFDHMLNGIRTELTGNKISIAVKGDWPSFLGKITEALDKNAGNVPSSFFEYYSFVTHAEKLVKRLNSL